MASRFWVGGSASWNGTAGTKWATTSGGAGGAAEPTSADDVFLDGASGNAIVTVDSGAGQQNCLSLNCTGFTGTLANVGADTINIFANLVLAAGMSITFGGSLIFKATTSGQTVTFNGKSINVTQLTFNGAGGVWTFQDAATLNSSLLLVLVGTLDVNGKTTSCGSLQAGSGTTLTLGAASVTASGQNWTIDTGSTFNANTSSITLTNANVQFLGGDKTYNNVTFANPGGVSLIQNANTFGNLTFTGPNATGGTTISVSSNQIVSTLLSMTVFDSRFRCLLRSNAGTQVRTITAASVSITGWDFQDITAAGAASPFTGTRLGDCGNNTNITTDAPANKFWVGNTGNSTDANVWATTSGGAGATVNYPLPQDTLKFDAGSFNANGQTYTWNGGRHGSYLFSGTDQTYNFNVTAAVSLFGNITLDSNATTTGAGLITASGRGTMVITSVGKPWTQRFTIDAFVGTMQLADDLTSTNASGLTHTTGTFDLNGKTKTTISYTSTGSASREIKSSAAGGKLAVNNTAAVTVINAAATLTVTRNSWTVEVGGNTTNTRTFAGAGLTWPSVNFSNTTANGRLNFTGANTLKSLSVASPPQSIGFTNSTTTTVEDNDGFPSGTPGNLVTIGSIAAANHTLAKAGGGSINVDYVSVSRSTATPGSTWFAGANSTDGGNNSGWTFAGLGPITGTLSLTLGAMFVSATGFNPNFVPIQLGGGPEAEDTAYYAARLANARRLYATAVEVQKAQGHTKRLKELEREERARRAKELADEILALKRRLERERKAREAAERQARIDIARVRAVTLAREAHEREAQRQRDEEQRQLEALHQRLQAEAEAKSRVLTEQAYRELLASEHALHDSEAAAMFAPLAKLKDPTVDTAVLIILGKK